MKESAALLAAAERHLYPNYVRPGVILERGQGSSVWDREGNRYIDLYSGVAVSALGHSHPALVEAISSQAKRLIHVANYFYNEPAIRLAESLCELTKMDRVFLCNSGTEAVEALIKLSRKHFYLKGQAQRFQILAFENSFHGRTLGALSATGQPKYREGFGPLLGVTHVPYGDLEAARRAYHDEFAGVLVEPMLGEGGVIEAPPGFIAGLRELTQRSGSLLLADEIQTGVGRTGAFLGFTHFGVKADAIALAKGLGGGVPIGAVLTPESLARSLPPGAHGTTFGGNPLAAAAALAVIDTVKREGLVERAHEMGQLLGTELAALAARYPSLFSGERGRGLLRALVPHEPERVPALLDALRSAGVLAIPANGVLRFCPALTITRAELSEALARMNEAFEKAKV